MSVSVCPQDHAFLRRIAANEPTDSITLVNRDGDSGAPPGAGNGGGGGGGAGGLGGGGGIQKRTGGYGMLSRGDGTDRAGRADRPRMMSRVVANPPMPLGPPPDWGRDGGRDRGREREYGRERDFRDRGGIDRGGGDRFGRDRDRDRDRERLLMDGGMMGSGGVPPRAAATITVMKLPFDMPDMRGQLTGHFSQFGTITDVRLEPPRHQPWICPRLQHSPAAAPHAEMQAHSLSTPLRFLQRVSCVSAPREA